MMITMSRRTLLAIILALVVLLGTACQPSRPKVRAQGSADLIIDPIRRDRAGACIDLDEGELTASDRADLCIEGGAIFYYALAPVNGARKYLFGQTAPAYEDCLARLTEFTGTNIPDYPSWPYICVLTNQKRLAVIALGSYGASLQSGFKLGFLFTTWDRQQDVAIATITPMIMCTPPVCDTTLPQRLYCPGECPGGCGTICATFTPEN